LGFAFSFDPTRRDLQFLSALGGSPHLLRQMRFRIDNYSETTIFLVSALPRISLLLLFNDGDEEFPAKCTVLFQRHAEYYLDPECLAI
jgi:hypothetical protein